MASAPFKIASALSKYLGASIAVDGTGVSLLRLMTPQTSADAIPIKL
jgi:hypothetical protein